MGVASGYGCKEVYRFPHTTVDREIFVLKIFRALKFHGAKFSKDRSFTKKFLTGVKLRWRLSNESCVSAATTCTSAFGRLLWERFFTVNESRQTVETDTLWLSNIRALNIRKPGHLRKYCNNENFPIYGIYPYSLYLFFFWSSSPTFCSFLKIIIDIHVQLLMTNNYAILE